MHGLHAQKQSLLIPRSPRSSYKLIMRHRSCMNLWLQVDHEAFQRMIQEHAESKKAQKELELKVKQ